MPSLDALLETIIVRLTAWRAKIHRRVTIKLFSRAAGQLTRDWMNGRRRASCRVSAAIATVGLLFSLAACGRQPSGVEQLSNEMSVEIARESPIGQVDAANSGGSPAGFAEELARAVRANPGYQGARSAVGEAEGLVEVASSVRRPQINGSSNLGGVREFGGSSPNKTESGVAVGLTVSQLIYDGGGSAAEIDQRSAEVLAAQAASEVLGNELALEAALAWVDVWHLDGRLRRLRAQSVKMGAMIDQMERMADNGFVDRVSLDAGRRALVEVELEDAQLASRLSEAQVRFGRYFDDESLLSSRPDVQFNSDDLRTVAWNLAEVPELKRAAAEVLVARSLVEKAQSEFRPTARLQGGINSPMQKGEGVAASVGVVLEYTFGDGGRRKAQLDVAMNQLAVAQAQLDEAKASINTEVDAAFLRLELVEQSLGMLSRQVELSRSEVETARSQIATGQSTLRQLFDAELQNYRANDRLQEMQAQRSYLFLRIASRVGELGRRIGLSSAGTHEVQSPPIDLIAP